MKSVEKSVQIKILMAFFITIIVAVIFVVVVDQHQSNAHSIGVKELDYGLVWYGRNGLFQKAVSGEPNPYYNLTNPTIIFIHGWMPDQVGESPTFMVDFPARDRETTFTLDLAAPWVDAGWNIGIFYWHPFSDEEFVWDAEDKIWTSDGNVGMRYRDINGNYYTEGMLSISVSELLLEDYLAAMRGFTGSEIRIAGHSLGNQLAVNFTSELIHMAEAGEISGYLLPSRVALLDPFWSPFPKTYLDGMETGEFIQQEIEQLILPNDILVEWYHSSWLTESTMIREDIPNLKAKVLFAELDPAYCGLLNQICKHDGAWHLYFLSYGSPTPPECIPDDSSKSCEPTGESGPMASTSDLRIAEMMSLPYYWKQDVGPDGKDGRLTPQTDDDWFHRLPGDTELE